MNVPTDRDRRDRAARATPADGALDRVGVPWTVAIGDAVEDIERKEVLGLELDGPRARAQGKAKAVWLWAEVEHEDERR